MGTTVIKKTTPGQTVDRRYKEDPEMIADRILSEQLKKAGMSQNRTKIKKTVKPRTYHY